MYLVNSSRASKLVSIIFGLRLVIIPKYANEKSHFFVCLVYARGTNIILLSKSCQDFVINSKVGMNILNFDKKEKRFYPVAYICIQFDTPL